MSKKLSKPSPPSSSSDFSTETETESDETLPPYQSLSSSLNIKRSVLKNKVVDEKKRKKPVRKASSECSSESYRTENSLSSSSSSEGESKKITAIKKGEKPPLVDHGDSFSSKESEEEEENSSDSKPLVNSPPSSLKTHLTLLRSLSARLLLLPPNDFQVQPLALSLRSEIHSVATVMNELDKGIWGRWKEVGLGKERKRGVERDVKEFWGRMEEVRREAEGEKEDREERGVIKTPEGLNDYLFASEDDILNAAETLQERYVIENPFTVLMRLMSGMRSFVVPRLLWEREEEKSGTKKLNPLRPPPKPKPKRPLIPFPDNPTPAGRPGYHKRPYSWKWYGYEPKKSKNKLERGFDEIEEDADEGLREIKAFARYGTRERWIVFFTLALIPALLAVLFVEQALSVYDSPPAESTTIGATMMEATDITTATTTTAYQ